MISCWVMIGYSLSGDSMCTGAPGTPQPGTSRASRVIMRVEPTPSVVLEDAGPGITRKWQLNDPLTRRDPPGTMFRIGRGQRRAVVARLPGGGSTVAAARGTRRLRSDVAAALRCLGLGDLAVS